MITAPADLKIRDQWLARLYEAIQEGGVDYLWLVHERWGELCGSVEVASYWADEFLSKAKTAWSDPRPGNYVRESSMCLSSLLATRRYKELLDVLALRHFPNWLDRKFGVQALLAEGQVEEALACAEASRGLNQPDAALDAACERILLDAAREAEAYEKYALTANVSSTELATYRMIARKYPTRDPKQILLGPAKLGDRGRRFAAAKDAGFLDLALHFAQAGSTDRRTLSRASRDLLEKDAKFSLQVGRMAIQQMLEGQPPETNAHQRKWCEEPPGSKPPWSRNWSWLQDPAQAANASSSHSKTPKRLRTPTILSVLETKLAGLTNLTLPPTLEDWRSALTREPMPDESR